MSSAALYTRSSPGSPDAAELMAEIVFPTPVVAGSPTDSAARPRGEALKRAAVLYEEQLTEVGQRVDRSFALLMAAQFVVCMLAAIFVAPLTWIGTQANVASHVWGAILLGALATAGPVFLATKRPGDPLTRHAVAAGQMMMSSILIHVTGGRIETHFHVFGSLAFLAFYRDWRVLATATAVVVADHFLRGLFWPQSIFGSLGSSSLRWLEHIGWVIFENFFLILSVGQSRRMLRDVAERRAELERARDGAEQANRAKDEFIAVLSHELRTPLTPSLLTLSVMAEDVSLSPEARSQLQMVRRNVELEARLIDDLLDLTRIAQGKIQLITGTVDVHTALSHILETCSAELAAKRITLQTTFEAGRHHLTGDAARLQQVFWNLMRNAIKFTPAGGRIDVHTLDHTKGIRIEFKDSGIGIPGEALPRLFTRFEQGSPGITRQFGGLGLGLSISRSIVDLHKGVISAFSAGEGRGATFTVDLPAFARPATPRAAQTQSIKLNALRRRRILLVDDHLDTLVTLEKMLKRSGYEVVTADSVGTALQKSMDESAFDLLISDIGLPDGTGRDLMLALQGRFGLPGIALSGYGMEGDVKKSLDAGFTAHLTKPIDYQRLKEVIYRTLEKRELARSAA